MEVKEFYNNINIAITLYKNNLHYNLITIEIQYSPEVLSTVFYSTSF